MYGENSLDELLSQAEPFGCAPYTLSLLTGISYDRAREFLKTIDPHGDPKTYGFKMSVLLRALEALFPCAEVYYPKTESKFTVKEVLEEQIENFNGVLFTEDHVIPVISGVSFPENVDYGDREVTSIVLIDCED